MLKEIKIRNSANNKDLPEVVKEIIERNKVHQSLQFNLQQSETKQNKQNY